MKSKVYFCREITPENVVKMYEVLGRELPGKVAVKLHSGEKGNINYLRPEFVIPMVERVKGTVVECNTAYPGARNYSKAHRVLIQEHKWDKYFDFDLMDEFEDAVLPIENGMILKENLVGKNLLNYDSMLVLSHFKGHPMGGYGGALKQLSIGCASSAGKSRIHSAGYTDDQEILWENIAEQDRFLECMADAAGSVVKHFGDKIAFINIMVNISRDCDCVAEAEPPCMGDIGILSSLDPVAIDQACIDLVYKSKDPGAAILIERIETRHGIHTIEAAAKEGYGSREYELIEIK